MRPHSRLRNTWLTLCAASTHAGYDDWTTWRLLCNSLFGARAFVEAFDAVEKGKERGHIPAEDTALAMLRFVAELGLQPEASKLWEQFRGWGLRLGREHYNAYMDTMMYAFAKRDTLQMHILGAAFSEFDTDGVNMALAALVNHPSQLADAGGARDPTALLQTMEANLAALGCRPTRSPTCWLWTWPHDSGTDSWPCTTLGGSGRCRRQRAARAPRCCHPTR